MILMISETLTSVANRSLFMFSFVLMTRFLAKSHYEIASIVWLIAGYGFFNLVVVSDKQVSL